MSLSRDFVEFIECLISRQVDYLLVGGHALAFHGLPRFTKDIDFWVRPTVENADKILLALDDFGFSKIGLSQEDFTIPGRVVQLGQPPNRIDLLTSIDGVEFDPAFLHRVKSEYRGTQLWVIGKKELIENKRSTGRKQDLLDVELLTGGDP